MKYIFALLALITNCSLALADVKSDGFEAPALKPQNTMVNMIYLIVCAAVIIAVAMKNPRRSL